MASIFYGFIFLFFDFTINIDIISFGLIPDFVGYIFIVIGLGELRSESRCFERARPWAVAMAVYAAVEYVLGLFGIMSLIQMLASVIDIGCFVIYVYIMAMIINGIKDMEVNNYTDYNAAGLRSIWIAEVVLQTIVHVMTMLSVISSAGGLVMLQLPLLIAILVIHIIFLIKFNDTRKAIEFAKVIFEAKKKQEERMWNKNI